MELIEAFLLRHDMAPSRFGILLTNDPAFVLRMRRGRALMSPMQDRIIEFTRAYDAAHKSRIKKTRESALT